ncbi:MAG: TIGR01777 family oxidoreductase [Bacteroidota bacterium]
MANILIGGGSGLVGQRLCTLLTAAGHQVALLSRRAQKRSPYPVFVWDAKKGYIDPNALAEADYVINLAGAGIADARWSKSRKALIISSRVETTRLLLNSFKESGKSPKAYLSASAVGFYGDRGEEWMREEAAPGQGFLSESTQIWEQSIQEVAEYVPRTIAFRIGIVLSTLGGALEKMLLPMNVRTGTYFGDGQQFYSWIHIDDLCEMFRFAIDNEAVNGIYNAVAPNPSRNIDLVKAISTAMDKAALILPAPAFGLRLAMGEMADVVLSGNRVSADKIEQAGFKFQFPELVPALRDVLDKKI